MVLDITRESGNADLAAKGLWALGQSSPLTGHEGPVKVEGTGTRMN